MGTKSSRLSLFAAMCAGLLAWGAAVAQPVTIARDSSLHAEPQTGAAVVARLKQGESAEQIGRQGAWVNVKSASGTGWLFSFNVTYGPGAAPAAGGGAAAMPERRAVTSTIGIRGLEAEDLRQARFDETQLNLLDKHAVSKQDAQAAAHGSGLSAVRVQYLDK